jgi:hypothetical protein
MSGYEQVTTVCSAAVHWQTLAGAQNEASSTDRTLTAQQQCVSCFSAKLYIAVAVLELLLFEEYSLMFNGTWGQSGRDLELKLNNDRSPKIKTSGI